MDYRQERVKQLRERRTKRKKERKAINILSVTAVILIAILAVGIMKASNTGIFAPKQPAPSQTPIPTEEPAVTLTAVPESQAPSEPTQVPATPTPEQQSRMGTKHYPIPDHVQERIKGKSYKENNNISMNDLAYLEIPHYDFDYNVQMGEMIVNKAVADDVLKIFAELYDDKYPIECMKLVDEYNADDFESIEYNNTSAFNYRLSTDGSGRVSQHGLGRAIDINPRINPYVNSDGTGAHENAREYWSRNYQNWSGEYYSWLNGKTYPSSVARAAYIGPEVKIYEIFDRHGWTWGGHWSSYRDYQHFEKRN